MKVTKEDASEGSTVYAQGGVSAVLAQTDTHDDHVYDTMVAGDFLNDRRYILPCLIFHNKSEPPTMLSCLLAILLRPNVDNKSSFWTKTSPTVDIMY